MASRKINTRIFKPHKMDIRLLAGELKPASLAFVGGTTDLGEEQHKNKTHYLTPHHPNFDFLWTHPVAVQGSLGETWLSVLTIGLAFADVRNYFFVGKLISVMIKVEKRILI